MSDHPLSLAQERLWLLDQFEPGNPVFHVSGAFRLTGPPDRSALERALRAVVRRHEALRTTVAFRDGRPVGVVAPTLDPPFPEHDLAALNAADREAESRRLAVAHARRPFDLRRGPLLSAALLRLGPDDGVLLLCFHQLAADARSLEIFHRELTVLCEAFSTAGRSPLPELAAPYAAVARRQRQWLQGEEGARELAWWRRRLAGAPAVVELPTDRPRGALPSYRGARRSLTLAVESTRQKVGRFTCLLAAFQLLLRRTSGQLDLVVGAPVDLRDGTGAAGTIGPMVNLLALRTQLADEMTAAELLERTAALTAEAREHGALPFEALVDALGTERHTSHQPLFQVTFVFRDSPGIEAKLEIDPGTAPFDWTLEVEESAGRMQAVLEYDAELFDATTASRALGHFRRLLEEMAAGPDRRLAELPILSGGERHQLLVAWPDTRTPYPKASLPELFEAQVEATPDAVAVVFATDDRDQQLSYRELNRRANRLAHHLRSQGVNPEVCVGLCVDRSPEMVVAILGILKAGGVYVPLDPSYPTERLAFMLDDVEAPVLLIQEHLRERLPLDDAVALVSLSDSASFAGESAENPPAQATADHLAYVMFTSGSTGIPKGVSVPHRAVVRLVRETNYARLSAGEVFLQLAPISFDASTLELWAPLLHGGRLVVFPPHPPSLRELGATLARHRVTALWLTAGLFHQMVDENLEGLRGVRQLLAGGDVLSARHLRRVLAELPGCTLINGYGPTENTTFTCCHPMRTPDEVTDPVSIGRAIANTRVHVLDHGLRPVPVGVYGELMIAGDGLARGYFKRPALTAERFVPNPLDEEAGRRLYRTGDVARYLPDGTLEFLGRRDFQVKVRGFRIELGEIEAALAAHPEVRESAVVAQDAGAGDKRLVAFVVPTKAAPSAGELRRLLRETLPDYMVPSAFVPLESLPLNPNGKVDRTALGRIAPDRSAGDEGFAAPRTPVEEVLATIWAEVLEVERVGVHDDFFDLGGHSLLATRVAGRIRDTFGVELPLHVFFEAANVGTLAAQVELARRRDLVAAAPPLVPVPRAEPLPLSYAQQRLWFLDRYQPQSPVYNIFYAFRLRGELDRAALEWSLREIVRRHQALRTRLIEIAGHPCQVIDAPPHFPLAVVDTREAEIPRLANAEARRPFRLDQGPLIRAGLLRLEAATHVLFLNIHHVAADGWSMGVFYRELEVLYGARARGDASPLSELAIQYPDFAVWQQQWLEGEVWESQLAYWRGRLAGMQEVLELPADRPRPPVQSYDGASCWSALPPRLTHELKALSRARGSTLFMTLLAAFQALLGRCAAQDDVTVGSPVANRNRAEIEGLIGFFVNTLLLRTDLGGDPTFGELLGRVREGTLGAYAHQDLPFEKLVAELAPQRDLSRQPLFQVMFVLQNTPGPPLRLPGLEVSPLEVDNGTAKFDLTLYLDYRDDDGDGLSAQLEYNRDLFDQTTILRLFASFRSLLEGIAADPERHLSALPLMPPAARRQLLGEWNDTATSYRAGTLMHQLFEAQAGATPEAAALVWGEDRLSYRELNRRANRLAHHLRSLDVEPEELVGLCIERSPAMVVGILAILKAGGAYLPLDPGYPQERLAFMLEDAGVRVLLSEAALLAVLPEHRAQVVLLDDPELFAEHRVADPVPAATASNLAYLIYTSGSTGRAKGVAIAHRSAAAMITWARGEFTPREVTGVLASTSICFDLSVYELFVPLSRGGTVILVENALELPQLPAAAAVTLVNTVPSALRELLRLADLPRLVRTVNLAGEALPRELVDAAYRQPGVERVLNLYGPSEDTTYSTYARLALTSDAAPPIGRPVSDTRAYVLDRRGRPLPPGVPGELTLGGEGLARCYLGRPELSAERWVPDPFCEQAGERLYRTGDLVRVLADGELAFLGRLDHQVKVRGFRIELGEVEAVLRRHPGVREAVVVVEERAGDPRLVVYLVADGEPAAAELRAHLRAALPEYMVPSAFVAVEAMPLGATGKVDRTALGRRAVTAEALPGAAAGPRVAPRTPLEQLLAAIWSQVLGEDEVGVFDHFFALGGHSLLAAQVLSRLGRELRVDLPLRTLFERPTIAALAEVVAAAKRRDQAPPPPLRAAGPQDRWPLSFAQQRLWFLDRLEPGLALYNIPAAIALEGRLEPPALDAALDAVVRRHQVLRTTFETEDGEPIAVVRPHSGLPLPVVDLAALPEPARRSTADRLIRRLARRPFDLATGPVLRAALLRLDAQQHRLLVVVHHIAFDGWSTGVFLRELEALYATAVARRRSPLPELELQYADFAAWQRRWFAGAERERQLGYWRERLRELPVLELPGDRPRPARQSFRGATERFALPAALDRELRELNRRHGSTRFITLVSAFQALLGRYAAQDDVAVAFPVANRNRAEIEHLLGFFVNTLVLRADLAGGTANRGTANRGTANRDPSFAELVAQVRDLALGAYAHQDLPFEQLVEELQPQRDLSRNPLAQVMFVLQDAVAMPEELAPGLAMRLDYVTTGTAKFDLVLGLEERSGRLEGDVEYNTALFDRTTIRRLVGHFRTLLEEVVAAPERRVSACGLLTPPERQQLLVEWRRQRKTLDRCVLDQRGLPVPVGVPGELCIGGEGEARDDLNRPQLYRSGELVRWLPDGELESLGRIDQQVKIHRRLPAPGRSVARRYEPPRTATEQELGRIFCEVLDLERAGRGDDFFALGGHSLLATRVASRVRETFAVELSLRTFFEAPTLAALAQRIDAGLRTATGDGDDKTPRRRVLPPIRPLPRAADGLPRDAVPLSFAQQRLWFLEELAPGNPFYNSAADWWIDGRLDLAALEAALAAIVRRHEVLRTVVRSVDGEPVQIVRPDRIVRPAPTDRPLPVVDLAALPEAVGLAEAERLAAAEGRRPFDLTRDLMLRAVLLRCADRRQRLLVTLHHIASDGWSWQVLLNELVMLYEAPGTALPQLRIQYADFAVWQRQWLSGEVLAAELAYWRDALAGVPLLELPADRPRPTFQRFRGGCETLRLPAEREPALAAVGRRHEATLYMILKAAFDVLLWRTTGQRDLVAGTPIANRNHAEIEGLIGFFVNSLVLRTRLPEGDRPFPELLARVREVALGAYAHQDLPFEKLVEHLHPERDLSRNPIFQVLFALQNAVALTAEMGGLVLEAPPEEAPTTRFDLEVHVGQEAAGLVLSLFYDRDLFDPATMARMARQYATLLEAIARDDERRLGELPLLTPAACHQLVVEWSTGAAVPADGDGLDQLVAAQAQRTPEAVAVAAGAVELRYRELIERAEALARHLRQLGCGPDVIVGVWAERAPETMVGVLAVLAAGGACMPLDPSYPGERLAFMLADSGAPLVLARRDADLPETSARIVWLEDPIPLPNTFSLTPSRTLTPQPPLPAAPAPRGERGRMNRKYEGGGYGEGMRNRTGGGAPSPRGWVGAAGRGGQGVRVLGGGADRLAYVLYTSGSTGRPKGVAMPHRPLVNLVRWQLRRSRRPLRTLQLAPLSFDVAFHEIFSTWAAGGTLVLVDEDRRRDPDALIGHLRENGIERLFLPFVALRQLAEAAASGPELPALVEVITAGEQLQVGEALQRFFARQGGAAVLDNQYGPTETHVVTAEALAADPAAWPPLPPIGRPIAGVEAVVLAPDLRPPPPGAVGEILLGGVAPARGYLGRPALTAERFVPHPFARRPGRRLYRTGDLGRHLADGRVQFLGRCDQQLKIRGFRVEPGEIEATIDQHPAVQQTAVTAAGADALAAYVVLAGSREGWQKELMQHARQRLPEYLVPTFWVRLEALPRLPSGKVDRRSLPAPDRGGAADVAGAEDAAGVPRTSTEQTVTAIWCEVLERPSVGVDDNFFDVGGHSLRLIQVRDRLHRAFGRKIPVAVLFRFPTVRRLADHLAGGDAAPEAATVSAPATSAAIAIIGIAGRFPGADDVDALWELVAAGREGLTHFRREQLLEAGIPPAVVDDPRYVPVRGVIEDSDLFDADLFQLSPREAQLLDPQHRLFLEVSWQALESAGYAPQGCADPVGVYAGVSPSFYMHDLLADPQLVEELGYFPLLSGNRGDFLPTRLSYHLDLKGPSINVQTACSTSLVAVHLACRGLLDGECRMALAGGVTVGPRWQWGYLYEQGGIQSPDGHCRAFDAEAAGTVGGDAVAVVVLKRLADAVADGDTIRAVIRGSAVNNDGSFKVGFTAPGVEGQAAVVRAAHAAGGVGPETIGYVETHGTGTRLGDPIEIAALERAFGKGGRCALGSLKTNVGHLDSASGVAGLIKAVLALEHRQIPPSLHFKRPNPEIDFAAGPFYVATELADWPAEGDRPRRAGVSSFAMGGTNAHAVLEEAPVPAASGPSRPWQLLVLSARTPAALDAGTERLAAHLDATTETPLADVAHTLRVGRRAFAHRRIAVCRDPEDAVRALRGEESGRLLSMASPAGREVAFLLPGIGEHYPGMGAGLHAREAVFRDAIERCAELARPHLGCDLRQLLFPEGSQDRPDGGGLDLRALLGRSRTAGGGSDELERTRLLHPAVFVLEYALAKLWMSWGVRPAAMLGHSLGEYVAACLAGVFPLADALELVCERARLIDELPGGAMLAVTLPEEQMGPYLDAGVSLAAVNSPEVSVVAGEDDVIAALSERLEADGVVCRRLAAAHAFHSTMMEPVAAELVARFRGRRLHAPEIPFLSNVTGDWITAREATDPEYWARHLCRTVRFADGLTRLLDQDGGEPVLLEVGPGHGLGTMALQHPAAAATERIVVATLPGRFERRDDQAFLLSALGRLWMAGAAVDWAGFQGDEVRRRVALPTYPFERRRFRIEPGRRPAVGVAAAGVGEEAVKPARAAVELHSRPAVATAYEAPADELQREIAEIWQQLLGIAQVGIHDSYFDLGGNSLVGTVMLTRLRQRFGVELGLERLFAAPTVAEMAAVIHEEGEQTEATRLPPIRRIPRDGRELPLSFGQERLWFLDRLTPDSSFYHLPSCWLLRGRLDVDALQASLTEIERRHDVLRTVLQARDGKPVQIVRPPVAADRRLPVVDLSALGLVARRAEAGALTRAETRRPFDLECDPMLRTVLLRLGGEEHQFLLTLHHIVGDAWSWNVLLTELVALYGALSAARPATAVLSPLPELAIRYADFAVWQRGWLRDEVLAAELAWWRGRVAGAPVLELPTDRPRPALQRFRGGSRILRLPPEITDRLEALSRRHGATLFMVTKAAFDVLLWRATGQRDLVVGTPIANRNHPGIEELIGFFVNTLVLRTRLPQGGATPFAELFAQVREAALGAFAHQDLPFEILVEHLDPDRDLSRNPIAQVLFALQNAPVPTLELPGLVLGTPALEMDSTRFDIEVHAWPQPQGLELAFCFDRDLFDGTAIARLAKQYARLLEALAEQPARRLHELPLLGPGERHHIVVEWNDTVAFPRLSPPLSREGGGSAWERGPGGEGSGVSREGGGSAWERGPGGEGSGGGTSVHERFETQAARNPEAVALSMAADAGHWTYRYLNVRANRLAHHLRELGVGPDVTVGVALERSPEAVAALVAVLKAGGVYVPLDRSYPAERLTFMLDDAGVEVLLTRREWLAELPPHRARTVLLDADREAIARGSAENPVSGVTAENLSYMIYTSGSTGRPKGVALVHATLANLIAWQRGRPGFRAGARTLQFAALSFDVSLQEVTSTLGSGGTLCLPGEEERRDPLRLAELLSAQGIERLFLPFVALQQLAEAAAEAPPPALRQVITAGEQLQVSRQVERFFTQLPDCTLENQYGPSESHVVSAFPLAGPASAWPALPAIGRPVAAFRIYLLDADRQPVPPGVAGELFLSGAGLARGYHGRPDLTAEKFLPNPLSGDPLSGDPGTRMYATGDLGRFAADGTIEFLGRIDHQIKIRGFRVELGEIEAILSGHPGVREAAAAVRGDGPGDKRLVAYLVPQTDSAPAASELRRHLGTMLPDHMVPSVFVVLEALPLLPSGKVDRRALPAPEPGADAGAGERVAPRDPLEQILAAIWSQLLGLAEVGAHDDFFALGGHSLLATQVQSRIRRELEIELPLRVVFEQPTVAGLAASVTAALRRHQGLEAPPLCSRQRQPGETVPLSFAQQRLWFIDRFQPDSALYNLPVLFRLSGRLDRGALGRTLDEIVRRHQVLRTRFGTVDGFDNVGEVPVQVIEPAAVVPLPEIDLGVLAEPERRAVADRLASREAQRPFDLGRGPVLRAVLLKLGPEAHVLCVTVHHIAFDGWSIAVFLRELEAQYRAFVAGRSQPLPELEVQYADFAVWQRQWLDGEVLEAQLGYWREQLAGLPILELPCDRPRPAVQGFRGEVEEFPLPVELYRRLQELGEERGVTLFMTLLAAYQALLGRYTGQRDFAVGTPVANRNRAETEGLIGFFVNTLVLRADLTGAPRFAQLLVRAREVALGAYAHQDLPFEKLVEELEPERNLSQSPLIQVLFALNYAPPAIRELTPELRVDPDGVATEQAKFDLTLSLSEVGHGLIGALEYNVDLFDVTTIRRLAGHLEILLRGIVDAPERLLSELPQLSPAEVQQVVREWTDTGVGYPREAPVHELFEARMAAAPEAVAVVFENQQVSYRELNRRANRLAHHLRAQGVGGPASRPEVCVGLCVERSVEMVVGTLGILKAGGAYLPLDPSYPDERLALMLEDGGTPDGRPPLLLIRETLAERFATLCAAVAGLRLISLDGDAPALDRASSENPSPQATADHVAYAMFTSGSTGRPKGVAVPHRGVVRLVRGANYAELSEREVFLQFAPISFDASTLEIWGALLAGGRLVVFPAYTPSLLELGTVLERYRVTTLWLTAGLFHQMVDDHLQGLRPVRQLLTGGDIVSARHVRRVLEELPGCTVIDGYGPTESTTFTCCGPLRGPDEVADPVSIGRPIANTRIWVVDRSLRPVGVGIPGELVIGGDGLARGYLNRPAQTAESFLPNPLDEVPGARLYRTGDGVRWLPDGRLEFLGRGDDQVKIRGFRIELGEIEAALGAHPGVREAVVIASNGRGAGDRRLVACLVPEGEVAAAGELRDFLRRTLPEYMVPSAFLALEDLPLTPNGKVDRAALSRLAPEASEAGWEEVFVAPRTPVEEMIAEIWSQVLPAAGSSSRPISVHDNFFELGGHSLLATQLISRIRGLFGIELPLRSVFETPTLAGLTASCQTARQTDRAWAAPPIEPRIRDRDGAPLSFAQQRLWFLAQLEPEGSAYNATVPLRFAGALDRAALHRAFAEIVGRHEVLRTTFAQPGEEPVQVIAPAAEYPMPLVDLLALPAADREPEVGRLVGIEMRRAFDLERGPLFSTILLRLAPNDHVLMLDTHHIVFDGWSVAIIFRELIALYKTFHAAAEVRTESSPLPPLPIQYADFATWQQRWLADRRELERQLGFWREHLGSPHAAVRLAPDRRRREGKDSWAAYRILEYSETTSNALRKLTREQGATLFMTLMAAFQTLLHRHTGGDSVIVGTPIANRHRVEIEPLIGFFVNTLAFRSVFADDPPFRELLARLREATLEAYEHQDLPFEKVVEALAPDRTTEAQPLFQTFVAFQNAPMPELQMPGLVLRPLEAEFGRRNPLFDLSLSMSEQGERLVGNLEYDASLFEETTIDILFDHFRRLLEEIAADPDRRVSDLRLISEVERREILAERGRLDPRSEVWDEIRTRLERVFPGLAEAPPPHYLLDRRLRLVPLCGQGEIYLEGVDAAEVDNPAAAAATWRPHPFADEPGARLVATGLRGRRRADGRLELTASPEPAPPPGEERRDKTAAELTAADELRSEFTSRQEGLSEARRALLARRLRGRQRQ